GVISGASAAATGPLGFLSSDGWVNDIHIVTPIRQTNAAASSATARRRAAVRRDMSSVLRSWGRTNRGTVLGLGFKPAIQSRTDIDRLSRLQARPVAKVCHWCRDSP